MTKGGYILIRLVTGHCHFPMLLVLLVFSILETRAQSSTLVVPPELSNATGTKGGAFFVGDSRDQQVYAASEFAGSPSDIIEITGVAFRPETLPSHASLDVVIPALHMRMGVFRGSPDQVPAGFANLENPVVVVTFRSLHLTAPVGLGFTTEIAFDTPFVYDRRQGSLVLEFLGQTDASLRSGGFEGEVVSPERGLFLYSADPGDRFNFTFTTQFSYVAVPEPSVSVLLFSGLAFCLWRRARAKPRAGPLTAQEVGYSEPSS